MCVWCWLNGRAASTQSHTRHQGLSFTWPTNLQIFGVLTTSRPSHWLTTLHSCQVTTTYTQQPCHHRPLSHVTTPPRSPLSPNRQHHLSPHHCHTATTHRYHHNHRTTICTAVCHYCHRTVTTLSLVYDPTATFITTAITTSLPKIHKPLISCLARVHIRYYLSDSW
jgi:hypothetical protein